MTLPGVSGCCAISWPVFDCGFGSSAATCVGSACDAVSAAFTASSTTAWPAAASPFMTFAALSMMPMVPLIAWIGSLPARIVSSTVSVILARMPLGPAALGVLAVEEFDVVEDLVAALVAQRVEQAGDSLLEQIVHRLTPTSPSIPETTDTSSATGVAR